MSVSEDDVVAVFSRYRGIVPDWPAFLDALRRPLPAAVWANPGRIDRNRLRALLAADGESTEPLAWQGLGLRFRPGARPGLHWGLLAGLFQVQEEAAMLPVKLLDPRPGERVLDLCSAPGNKTAQIAAALAGRGTVVANDLDSGRLAALRQTVKRLGLFNITATSGPAQTFPGPMGYWDRVLADVPCSGDGTWRKAEGARAGRVPPVASAELLERQFRILRRAFQLCRVGGRVVYATCSLAPEENEAVIDRLLRECGSAVRLRVAEVPGFSAAPGVERWGGRVFHPWMGHCLRIWPHLEDTGGFFVAVMDKCDGEPAAAPPAVPRRSAGAGLLDALRERFGLDEGFAASLAGLEGRRYLSLVNAGHAPVTHPGHQFTGLPAIGVQIRPPKPTTALAMCLAGSATRNVVDLTPAEARGYLGRETVQPRHGARGVTAGYVLVRYRGFGLGIAHAGSDACSRLESLYPRAWRTGARERLEEHGGERSPA